MADNTVYVSWFITNHIFTRLINYFPIFEVHNNCMCIFKPLHKSNIYQIAIKSILDVSVI